MRITMQLVVTLVSVCLLGVGVLAATARRPVIIDTDVDIDDLLAISYAVRHPALDVKAITCVGNAWSDPMYGVPNVLFLLEQLGCGDLNIPVSYGATQPLLFTARPANTASLNLVGPIDTYFSCLGYHSDLHLQASHYSSVELIVATIKGSPTPVDLLVLGSLTNVALALERDRTIVNNIGTVYLSGGTTNISSSIYPLINPTGPNPGDTNNPYSTKTKGSAWNEFVDPLAAVRVFSAGLRLVFMDSGVQSAFFPYSSIQTFAQPGWSGMPPLVASIISNFPRCTGQAESAIAWWDESAAMLMTDIITADPNPICTMLTQEDVMYSMDPDGSMARGFTTTLPEGFAATVCQAGNVTRFLTKYINTVSSGVTNCPNSNGVNLTQALAAPGEAYSLVSQLQAQVQQLTAQVTKLQTQVNSMQNMGVNAAQDNGPGAFVLGALVVAQRAIAALWG